MPPFSISPDIELQLRGLISFLLEANRSVNLTAERDSEQAWVKHVLDPMQAAGLVTAGTAIDVGAGPGFPGLALAMAVPGLCVTFLDSTAKKGRFTESALAAFGMFGEVVTGRAEDAGHDLKLRGAFDYAFNRAVGSLPEVLELCLPFLKPGGLLIAWRGAAAGAEAEHARQVAGLLGGKVEGLHPYRLPGREGAYALVCVRKTAVTDRRYPRRNGLPKQEPMG